MDSMDFDIGIEDVGVAVLQELWNKVAHQAMGLSSETKDLLFEKDSFQEFSRSISKLNILLSTLNAHKVEDALGLESTNAALTTLNLQLKKASKIIKDYKCGSRLRLLLKSHSMLMQMEDVAKDIAKTVSSFQLVNLDMALNLQTMTNQIINNLGSMEFRSASATELVASEMEKSMSQNSRNRETSQKLLEKIADAVGARPSASLVQNELELLKQEKEEMEAEKMQAEAFQLSQLIEFLYSTEIVTRPELPDDDAASTYHQQYPIRSFICELCKKMMTDPVAIQCGHSFEKKAIQEHFERGEKNCPICRQELSSQELTPNHLLRNSIEEWKQRDMDLKFRAAVPGIKSNDHSRQDKALEDMQFLLEMPRYTTKLAEAGLAAKLVEILKDDRVNAVAALKCLYCLAQYNDDQKEAIVKAGAIRRIVKHIYKGGSECHAIAVLLELSEKETLGEKIGDTKDCIPLLVSLLHKNNPEVSEKAHKVLQNLSSNIHFVVRMAQAGHFKPFVARFNEASQEARALMAAELSRMQLKGNNIEDLKERQFIHNLMQMLSSSSPAYKSACLKSIKKLVAYHKIVKRLLKDPVTIPHLLGLISFNKSDPHLKQEAAEILAKLIEASQQFEQQKYQGLQELQSKHNVCLMLQIVTSAEDETKIQFLHLLVELSYKSEIARDLIRSENDAIAHLFSSLYGDHPVVRRWAMKLIYCISEGHPDGVPLPPSPAKEIAINTLATILISSPDTEERSAAARIISQLPRDDSSVDEVLRKSEALKAIHEVICSMDDENSKNMAPAHQDTSLLENALAALLRYTEPTKPELQRQLGKLELYPSLVRVLTRGSSLAKQRTAIALAQLSQSTSFSVSDENNIPNPTKHSNPLTHLMMHVSSMLCFSGSSANENLCRVHGAACSPRDTFCLVKADAVKPLVRTLSETGSGVAEASLMALETLLRDHSTQSHATAAIVDSQGVVAILQVLERGSLSAKTKAIDLFQKILVHTKISDMLWQRSERILIQLLHDDELKKKAALVLRQMEIIPEQSSYF